MRAAGNFDLSSFLWHLDVESLLYCIRCIFEGKLIFVCSFHSEM